MQQYAYLTSINSIVIILDNCQSEEILMPNVSQRMTALTKGLPSKSEKMRVLARAGYGRKAIAEFLGTRYQFVRNVLVEEEARNARQAAAAVSGEHKFAPTKLRLGPDGRVVIPVAFREALGISDGDMLIASIVDGELHLLTIPAAIRRAQAIVRQHVPEGVSLVDELLEDRRREVEREHQDG
jgi:bifunctional DNA-binding transcriptional regulator/antitoxin component of YhaV-PrlF toxin-antitoxin module